MIPAPDFAGPSHPWLDPFPGAHLPDRVPERSVPHIKRVRQGPSYEPRVTGAGPEPGRTPTRSCGTSGPESRVVPLGSQ
jgi:hypothetical protein